jgi:hypothetical protein
MYVDDTDAIFSRALSEFSPEWKLNGVKLVRADGSDPELSIKCGIDQFGVSIVSSSGSTKFLGQQDTSRPGASLPHSSHPAVPGSALQAYNDGYPGPIKAYFKDIGLL